MAGTVPVAKSLGDIYPFDAVQSQTKRWERLVQTFQSAYGVLPTFIVRSPGRVNIIGEHIDYSLYSVLPMAIAADCVLAVSYAASDASSTDTIRVRLANVQADKFPPRDFEMRNDNVEIDSTVHEWTNYFKCGLKGALKPLRAKYDAGFVPKSMDIVMDGSVPPGGGLSSSAAFVSASALAVMIANGEKDVDKLALTELAIVSERDVGVNSGGMDQSASILSIQGSALYVSFVPRLLARPVHFPDACSELSFLIAQSFIAADKHVSGPVCYNLRVVECSLAAAYMHAVLAKTSLPLEADSGPLGISLRGFQSAYFANSPVKPFDEQLTELIAITESTLTQEGYTRSDIATVLGISVSDLEQRYESIFPVRAELFKLRQRALHVFSEALRVQKFLQLLEDPPELPQSAGNPAVTYNRKLGELMNETQESCRKLYECSCPEIDELCAIAREAGSYGSRLTGAGWGGCTVHLVPLNKVEAVKEALEREYYSKMNLTKEQKEEAVVISRPSGGSAVFYVGEGGFSFDFQ